MFFAACFYRCLSIESQRKWAAYSHILRWKRQIRSLQAKEGPISPTLTYDGIYRSLDDSLDELELNRELMQECRRKIRIMTQVINNEPISIEDEHFLLEDPEIRNDDLINFYFSTSTPSSISLSIVT
ncbi:MAG: hypothetical protein K0R66_1031 [Gammaproteobacteria bacterium]|jgi:hypothetical protein|nr:hypothetical protein [Gammaproteobacteria bacterium]